MARERREGDQNIEIAKNVVKGALRCAVIGARIGWEVTKFGYRYVVKPTSKVGYRATEQSVRWAADSQPRYSRRTFIAGMLASAATVEGARRYGNGEWPFQVEGITAPKPEARDNAALPPTGLEAVFPHMPEQRNVKPTALPFYDADANKEARDLGIDVGDFFNYDGMKLNRKLTAFTKDTQLLPIFPPTVIAHKDLIYSLSDKFDIPVNVIATIMTMESGGKVDAQSNLDNPNNAQRAQGLFSVMPTHFHDRKITDFAIMRDPKVNGSVAMEVFKDFVERSRRAHKGLSETYIYHRALMGYNGGNDAMTDPLPDEGGEFTNWESFIYGDHAMRFALTAQIASKLRENGFTDVQIASKLSSYEVDARAAGLGKFYSYFSAEIGRIRKEIQETNGSMSDPKYKEQVKKLTAEYLEVCKELGKQVIDRDDKVPGLSGVQPYDEYHKYLAQTSTGYQRSPALEIWASTNGGLNYEHPNNFNESIWRNLDTKKTSSYQIPSFPIPRIPEIRIPGVEVARPKIQLERQRDPKWNIDEGWDGEATCGPTTVAMILKAFGENANPALVDREFRELGFREGPSESTILRNIAEPGKEGAVLSWLQSDVQSQVKKKRYDVKLIHDFKSTVENQSFDYQKADAMIKSGHLIIASGLVNWLPEFEDSPNYPNHIFGISEVDIAKKQFKVFDPWTGKEHWVDDSKENLPNFFYSYGIKPKS